MRTVFLIYLAIVAVFFAVRTFIMKKPIFDRDPVHLMIQGAFLTAFLVLLFLNVGRS